MALNIAAQRKNLKAFATLLSQADAVARREHLHLVDGKPVNERMGPLKWAHEYALIRTASGDVIRYRDAARDYQDAILADTSSRQIVGKSRQIGISQTYAFVAAEEAISGGTVLVVSKSLDQAALFLNYVYVAIQDAPHPRFVSRNTYSLKFDNGGSVTCQPSTQKAGRGVAATLVILDEQAWQGYAREIFTAIIPTLSTTKGRLVVLSTPHGIGNLFEELWTFANSAAAVRPDGSRIWSVHYLPWWVNPNWDDNWAEAMKTDLGPQAFAQEHDVDFAASGDNLFPVDAIARLWTLPDYQAPIRGHSYVTAWDIGRDGDPFTGFTLDVSTSPFQIVHHRYHFKLPYPEQAGIIDSVYDAYPGVHVVESNGPGDPLIEFLHRPVEPFFVTALTKKNIIDALQIAIAHRDFVSPKIETLAKELITYVRADKKIRQDTVMALATAIYYAGRPVQRADVLAGGRRDLLDPELVALRGNDATVATAVAGIRAGGTLGATSSSYRAGEILGRQR